jgi:hypothetical protein
VPIPPVTPQAFVVALCRRPPLWLREWFVANAPAIGSVLAA